MQAQLLVASAAMLRRLDPSSPHAASASEIVTSVLAPAGLAAVKSGGGEADDVVNVRKVGLSCLAGVVGQHNTLLSLYSKLLLSLPVRSGNSGCGGSCRSFVLSTDPADTEELAVAGGSTGAAGSKGRIRLPPLPLTPGWSGVGLKVAQQIVADVQVGRLAH